MIHNTALTNISLPQWLEASQSIFIKTDEYADGSSMAFAGLTAARTIEMAKAKIVAFSRLTNVTGSLSDLYELRINTIGKTTDVVGETSVCPV